MTLEELLQKSIDLNNEKLAIEAKRVELANKQLEINNAILAEKRRLETEKVQVVTVESIKNGRIVLETNGTPRLDVLDLLRATPTRFYNIITHTNEIEIRYWQEFVNSLEKLPNIQLTYSDGQKDYLTNYFNEPLWSVSKNDKYIIIKQAERNTDNYKLNKIPSASYNTVAKAITAPFSEGWRILQVLGEPSDTVSYSPDVLELIVKQVEQRKKMDEAALVMDADIPNPFTQINPETGKLYELKGYQKATVFFMMTALGMEIPKGN